jgi:hypothetical protein
MVVNAVNTKGSSSTVRFGSVVVKSIGPKAPELRRNVSSGQTALARAATKIIKAGVSLPKESTVPLYHADPKEPGRLVRELNGKMSVGVFVEGKFKVLSRA